jgi:hypothetical protein
MATEKFVWFRLARFTRLHGIVAMGITIMAGSLPVWIAFFPIFDSFIGDDVGSVGAVFL